MNVVGYKLGGVASRNITVVKALSIEAYDQYKRCLNRLLQFEADQQLFYIVIKNYEEFDSAMNHYYDEYKQNPNLNWLRMSEIVLNINRTVLNFLSAFRTFLDHSETMIKRKNGSTSARLEKYKKKCSVFYDTVVSYRFLYKLRNYAQHCGMPIESVTLSSKAIENEVVYCLEAMISRQQLLENYDGWGVILKKDIMNMKETIEVAVHIQTVIDCLYDIRVVLIEDEFVDLLDCANFISKLIRIVQEKNAGVPFITPVYKENSISRKDISLEWIPYHLVKQIQHLKDGA